MARYSTRYSLEEDDKRPLNRAGLALCLSVALSEAGHDNRVGNEYDVSANLHRYIIEVSDEAPYSVISQVAAQVGRRVGLQNFHKTLKKVTEPVY